MVRLAQTGIGASIGSGGAAGRRAVLKILVPERSLIVGVCLLSGVANLLMLTAPLFMLQVYDRVIPSGSIPTLLTLFGLVAVLYAAQAIVDYCRGRVLSRIGEAFDRKLAGRFFRHDLDKAVGDGAPVRSPLNELAVIRRFLSGVGPSALLDVPWVPIYLLILASLHWSLGLLGVFGCVVVIVLAVLTDFATRKALRQSAELDSKSQALLTSVIRGAETAKVLGMSETLSRRFTGLRGQGIDREAIGGDAGARLAAVSRGSRMFLQSATLAAGAALAIAQEVTGGTIIAASIVLGRALAPIDQIVGHWRSISQARSALTEIAAAYDARPDRPQPIALQPPRGHLTVDSLAVGPPGSRRPFLSGVTLDLEPGDGLGIIGPSASGKSTLARALVGVSAPLAGEIRLDGALLDHWTSDELGRFLGYLPQDVELIGGSVRECIARHDPEARDEDVLSAASAAGAHEMILSLPDGYDAEVGEGGTALSGGQRQRIALARALYGDPVLIVLDEPNANLDQEGDAALTHAIHKARERGAVVVVITHRPSAMAAVDHILVLKDGMQVGLDKKELILRRVLTVTDKTGTDRAASQ